MSFDLAIHNMLRREHHAPRIGLQPEELIEAGILSNTETPNGAIKRARGLIEQGAYQRAREILYPHARTKDPVSRPKIAELLGTCALHCGGGWEDLFKAALHSFVKSHDKRGSARVYHLLGEGLLNAGDLKQAEKCLRRASELFSDVGDPGPAAMAVCARARVRMRAGDLKVALRLVDQALSQLAPLGHSHDEGLVRLVRARILAYLGASGPCAKELIIAERLLACSGSKKDRLLAAMVRAETLINLGQGAKAFAGLRRLLLEVVDLEDVHTRAWVHVMLGRAAAPESLPEARRHLMRAKHLFSGVGSDLGVADCDLRLAQVESRLGFAVHGRLHGLGQLPLHEWRLFAAELKIARAECISEESSDLARRLILEARSFGRDSGNRSLVRAADAALRACRLITLDEDLTPIDDERTIPNVHGGVTVTAGYVPPGGPQLFEEDTFVDSSPRLSESAQRRSAERLLGRHSQTSLGFGLTPPKGTVPRVA